MTDNSGPLLRHQALVLDTDAAPLEQVVSCWSTALGRPVERRSETGAA